MPIPPVRVDCRRDRNGRGVRDLCEQETAAITRNDTVSAIATQRFDARPEQVFAAWLEPRLIERWFGPGLGPLTRIDVDPRVGGRFLIVQRRGEHDAAHAGEYLEIAAPQRLVFTWRVPPESADASRVSVAVTTLARGCEATVTHEMDAKWRDHVDRIAGSWQRMLVAMAAALAP